MNQQPPRFNPANPGQALTDNQRRQAQVISQQEKLRKKRKRTAIIVIIITLFLIALSAPCIALKFWPGLWILAAIFILMMALLLFGWIGDQDTVLAFIVNFSGIINIAAILLLLLLQGVGWGFARTVLEAVGIFDAICYGMCFWQNKHGTLRREVTGPAITIGLIVVLHLFLNAIPGMFS